MTQTACPTAGLFVTATDTGVGKTYVTALIASTLTSSGRLVGAYKPVCSGAEFDKQGKPHWVDAETLTAAIGGRFDSERVCPLRFRAAGPQRGGTHGKLSNRLRPPPRGG